jgi:hypothetical protein
MAAAGSVITPFRLDHAGPQVSDDQAIHTAEHFICVTPIRAHYTRCELGPLPQIVVSRLCRGHPEPALEPFLQALDDPPLVLERLRSNDLQLPDQNPDYQDVT